MIASVLIFSSVMMILNIMQVLIGAAAVAVVVEGVAAVSGGAAV